MDVQIGMVIGVGIIMFALLYFAFQFREDKGLHILALKIFLIGFALAIGLLIPKTFMDSACYPVVNETIRVGNNFQYTYDTFCTDLPETDSPTIFFKAYYFMLRMGGFLIFLILNWILWFRLVLQKLGIMKMREKK